MVNTAGRVLTVLFLCAALFLTSCSGLNFSQDKDEFSEPLSIGAGIEYDAKSEEYVIRGKRWTNLFEYSQSPHQRYIIYVASQLNGDPEIWLYDENIDRHKRITRNDYAVESDARVDNNRNWICVLTKLSFDNTLLLLP